MNATAGLGGLIRLILRRDRVILPLWVLPLAGMPAAFVAGFRGLHLTDVAREQFGAAMANNPGLVALYGPLNDFSLGALTVWRSFFIFIGVALGSAFTVIRHTRAEEETGRRELVGAAVVARPAPLLAALLVAFGADLVLGGLATLVLIGVDLPVAGSLLTGFALVATGWAFAAVAAVAAQLTEGARAARALAGAALGAAYLLRAAGDVSGAGGALHWLIWLSPLAWAQQSRAYAGDRFWPVLLLTGFALGLCLIAYRLNAVRDVDAGLLPGRSGPAHAPATLGSPLGLAWRLHRATLSGWVTGFAVIGVVLGGAAKTVADSVSSNPQLADIINRMGGATTVTDTYIAASLGLLGVVASAYAVQATLRLRGEESGGRAEPVLATAAGRLSWATSHLTFGLLGPAVALAAGGLAVGLTYGATVGEVPAQLGRVLAGALVPLPAVWVLSGLALLLFGWWPRLTGLAWAALALWFLLGQLGAAFTLDQWLLDLSPFTHVPHLPGGPVSVTPLVWLVVVAAGLVGCGLVGVRRRDLE